jgi:hypothetical protein
MKPEHLISLAGVILTALLTGVGLYIGPKRAVRLALEQFRAEKWWERKATAYDDIVRSASRLCGFHCDCYASLKLGYHIGEEWLEACRVKNQEATAVLETHRFSGGFVISEEAGRSINRILNVLDFDCEGELEFHDRASDVLRDEVKVLKECAARDLSIALHVRTSSSIFGFVRGWLKWLPRTPTAMKKLD